MRGARGLLDAVWKGDRAALASDATLEAALRTADDRKIDLVAAETAPIAIFALNFASVPVESRKSNKGFGVWELRCGDDRKT